MGFFDWLSSHTGPESSGSQDTDRKSGGSSSVDRANGSYHHTDWSEKGGRASWDEKFGNIEDHHTTPSK